MNDSKIYDLKKVKLSIMNILSNEYKVCRNVRKSDFLNNGFSYVACNVLQKKKYLYKDLIQLIITVDYTEEDIGFYTKIVYANSGELYPTYNYYGKDEVKNQVISNYNSEINKLVRMRLIQNNSNKKDMNREKKKWRK